MPTDRQFTGQRWESSLGFYDYVARQYDPYLNRFISPDTIIPDPGNPQSLNRYAYVLNNALLYVDPSGHRETRYNEGEIIDEDTVNSNVYIEWNPLTKQEQAEVLLAAVGILGVPIVTMVAPAYAGRGAIGAGGYAAAAWFTGQKMDTTELLLAFYVGGISNEAWWWGSVSNNLQYGLACGIKGETLEWDEVGWNAATGGLATGLQGPAERLMGKGMGVAFGEFAEGATKAAAPVFADASAQWLTTNAQNMVAQMTTTPFPGYAPGISPGQWGPYPTFGVPIQHEHFLR